jgi:AraC-like DNA-binding protein
VKQIAADLGYASIPAFSHAFRQVTGKTPTEFVESKESSSRHTRA